MSCPKDSGFRIVESVTRESGEGRAPGVVVPAALLGWQQERAGGNEVGQGIRYVEESIWGWQLLLPESGERDDSGTPAHSGGCRGELINRGVLTVHQSLERVPSPQRRCLVRVPLRDQGR